MTVVPGPVSVPDSTRPTFALLRELRRGRARKQAASVAFWIYAAALVVGSCTAARSSPRRTARCAPPPPTAAAPRLLHAAPGMLAAAALLLLLPWRGTRCGAAR